MTITTDKTRSLISETATQWFISSREGEMSSAERRAFADWLKESPVHVSEYLAIARLWSDIGDDELTAALAQSLTEEAPDHNHANVVAFPRGATTERRQPRGLAEHCRTWLAFNHHRARISAASVILCFIALTMLLINEPSSETVYSTVRGEQKTIVLDDGSVLDLNTDSRISVQLHAQQRLVRLSRGEVYFDVAADPNRPFIVITDTARIQVTGTLFNIRHSAQFTDVTVIEGTVKVSAAGEAESTAAVSSANSAGSALVDTVELQAGNRVVVAEGKRIAREEVQQLNSVTAWKQQRLIFSNKTLEAIVSEFSRYNDINYQIVDSDTANRQFSGVFNSDDPESFLTYLQQLPNIDVTRYGNSVLIQSSP